MHSKTDSFGRKVFEEIQAGATALSREFSYHQGEITDAHIENNKVKSAPTTLLVKDITFSDGRTLSYEYDNEERITKVTDSVDGITEYTYDALGQLLTETVNGTVVTSMTYEKYYGNITTKNGIRYEYDNVWKDLLTKVGEDTISYDAQGNPVSYLGDTLTWEKGRQLKTYSKDNKNISFEYNANGIRTAKVVNGTRHEFTLDGTKILRIYCDQNYILEPIYDNEDSVCGLYYNSEPFYFQKNLQGDIIAISDYWGDIVARYTYDAWGKVTSITGGRTDIAEANPFRYRGYYYDTETNLYYLQSRYYDANVGRFINADEVLFCVTVSNDNISLNLLAYSRNTPSINIDDNGYSPTLAYTASSYQIMVTTSAAGVTLLTSLKALVASIWNTFVVVGLFILVIAAIVVICKTISTIYSTVKSRIKVDKNKYKSYAGKICVYVLARREKNINSIFYVGRTKNILARYNNHKKTKGSFYMYVIYTCSSVLQSRVVEQSVLATCLTGEFTSIVFGVTPSNKIRGIASANILNVILRLGLELPDTLSLLGCTSESDLYFIMNQ